MVERGAFTDVNFSAFNILLRKVNLQISAFHVSRQSPENNDGYKQRPQVKPRGDPEPG